MHMNHRILLTLIQTGTLVFAAFFSVSAQDHDTIKNEHDHESYSVRWVSQYPALTIKKEASTEKDKDLNKRSSKKNKNWFTNLLFGKKPADLIKPMSVLANSPDLFWIADQGIGSFFLVQNGVGEITQFRNKDIENLPSIVGSCFFQDDQILFTDSKLNKIFQFLPGNKDLQIFNDSASLEQPTGIAYSVVNKEVWVSETKAHRLAVLNEKGEIIKRIGERGNGPGQFNFPTYIWIDNLGIVYVVDAMNFLIQIFDKNGNFVSSFGEIGDASGYLSRPKGIATDSYGHIYIADALYHAIQVFDRTGKLLYVLGSQGEDKEQFWMPTGIFIDKNNFIYVADSYNSRVQIFKLDILYN